MSEFIVYFYDFILFDDGVNKEELVKKFEVVISKKIGINLLVEIVLLFGFFFIKENL